MYQEKKGAHVYVPHFSLFKSLTFLIVIEKTLKTIKILFFVYHTPRAETESESKTTQHCFLRQETNAPAKDQC